MLRYLNEAEAIVEPYFDGGDSDQDYAGRKCSLVPMYSQNTDAPALVRVVQGWCAMEVRFDGCKADGSYMEMKRELNVDASAYDHIRLFAALPRCIETALLVKYDGAWQTAGEPFCGNDTTSEHNLPLAGKQLEGVGYRFTLRENKPATATLHWLGFVNLETLPAVIDRGTGVYPSDWPDHMKKEDGEIAPQTGLWFGKEELPAMRRKMASPILAPYYAKLKEEAEAHLSFEPEKAIGEYVNHPDRRWALDRAMEQIDTAELMQTMAFVGLIEARADMLRMAARMALSVAHCTNWCEGPMGTLPGCAWHHRSFTEEGYARACATVLDWAGDFLTGYGKSCIQDAIAMKALPRLESDFRRMEYIRHMNQGICFNYGRLAGLLALVQDYPRYDIRIREAEEELTEMIEEYVLADGGTLEGPGYWAYTFSHALPQLYLLSRWHKKPFEDFVSPTLVKTGRHALALLSVRGDGTQALGLNDAHGGYYHPMVMAAYARIEPQEDYGKILAASFAHDTVKPTVELMILLPEEMPEAERLCRRGLQVLPNLGQARITREDEKLGGVDLFFLSGPAYFGHYHRDKGSFILETETETFCMDRGVTTYSHPDTNLLQLSGYHNLLYPERSDGSICDQQSDNNDGTGAKLLFAEERDGVCTLAGDTTGAWKPGITTHCTRKITTASAREYLIEDEMDLTEPIAVSFRVNTQLPVEITDTGAVLRGAAADLYIEPVNWTPCERTAKPESVNAELESVNLLRLVNAAAARHRLVTKLTLVPKE